MVDGQLFLLWWIINSSVFYLAPFIFVGSIVTGNVRLAPFMASLISGFILTAVDTMVMPVFQKLNIKLKDEWQWALAYFFVNVVGVWVIARYADLTGVGVASAWIAVILGFVLNLLQWLGWKLAGNKKDKK